MKRTLWSKEKKTARKLEISLYVFLAIELIVGLAAVFVWPPLCVGCGVWIVAYGVLHLIAAHKGWDRIYSFYVGGMADSYKQRHTHTIVSGILLVLLGVAA
ncbi:MAG: hypothetical protein IJN04_01800, partial [Clostridia bacterium]|nr:hypothetical protein [Clostridia bacterium]